MKWKPILILIGFLGFFLPVIASNADEWTESPNAEKYKQPDYSTTRHIRHGETSVNILEIMNNHSTDKPPHICRAWLEIIKSTQSVFKRYFDDIDPVGFSYGLFVPQVQLPSPYFAVVKEGDYDGRLFLIKEDGDVFDLMGGFYFLTDDKRYLFSEYSSDSAGLDIFDLKGGQFVFSSDNLPYIQQWYKKDGVYFFTESEWLGNRGHPSEKKGVAYFYDFDSHKIIKKAVKESDIAVAKAVRFDFDPREYKDCDCTNRLKAPEAAPATRLPSK